jgi:hypothetical protein
MKAATPHGMDEAKVLLLFPQCFEHANDAVAREGENPTEQTTVKLGQ